MVKNTDARLTSTRAGWTWTCTNHGPVLTQVSCHLSAPTSRAKAAATLAEHDAEEHAPGQPLDAAFSVTVIHWGAM